ncbi:MULTISPECIES: nucleotidyltransferase family protein [Halomonadaceae]|uniref:nucleotidyltransferase domain-containing protein n=1 Tax=Halomonadaceae TaxID=28256 RepID=UPI00159B78E3|nr:MULTISPECIES: nucleotidyltransferase family protein [Halomonas]QJQ94022.1 nucleotidyltransferase family protein [Halomonas sp. PA5]
MIQDHVRDDFMTVPSTLSPPDTALRLLLLLARLELSEAQKESVLQLCQQVDDWGEVIRRAQACFLLPLVYRHLRRLSPDSMPPEQLNAMKLKCMFVVQHGLRVAAAQQSLVRDLLEPLKIPHLFFKGPTLAARYYDDPAMRFCRDIDVLIARERMAELIDHALAQGYIAHDPSDLKRDRTSLEFVSKVRKVISLVSPHGVLIELHQKIDNTGSIYDSSKLIANGEHYRFNDTAIQVMPTSELFVYICLHHTKHYWSHLHWLADMDAIQRHADFDLDEVYRHAERLDLVTTVNASLELYRAMATPMPWDEKMLSEHGKEMVGACLVALQGGYEAELELRKTKVMPDYSFTWQANMAYRLRWQYLGWTRFFWVSYDDYLAWPLAPRWQWIYRGTGPFRKAYKHLVVEKAST